MKVDFFRPIEIAPDVNAFVRDAYSAIAEKLVKITARQRAVEEQRNTLRALAPGEVDGESLDRMRKLSADLLELAKEELQVRHQELEPWFGAFRREVSRLQDKVIEDEQKARTSVRHNMTLMGFPAPRVALDPPVSARVPIDPLQGAVSLHPTVKAITDRRERLRDLAFRMDNGGERDSGWHPAVENIRRCSEISAAIKAAADSAKSPMASASALI